MNFAAECIINMRDIEVICTFIASHGIFITITWTFWPKYELTEVCFAGSVPHQLFHVKSENQKT